MMKLPKFDLPRYKAELPWSERTVSYRPYTVKEERIYTMVSSNPDSSDEQIHDAVMQLIGNCVDVDITTLHPSEVEYLFVQLRSVSVSPFLDVVYYNNTCEDQDCPQEIDAEIDLSKSKLDGLNELYDSGFVKRNGNWVVMLSDTVGISLKDMKQPKTLTDNTDVLYKSILCIFDGDDVIPVDQISQDELREFVDGIPPHVAEKIKQFFDNQPKLVCDYMVTCPKCKRQIQSRVEGLSGFFD